MATARKRSALGPSRLVVKKIRVTATTAARLLAYTSQRDGKREADGWRDVIFAGLNVLAPAA